MAETIRGIQERSLAFTLLGYLHNPDSIGFEEAWQQSQHRITTMVAGDPVTDYMGRPDIQWGIIGEEIRADIYRKAAALVMPLVDYEDYSDQATIFEFEPRTELNIAA